jgi:acetyltransferase-like isoleucine patch superfamily enzyme
MLHRLLEKLKKILERTQVKVLEKASNQSRINYWRRKGMKIGDECLFHTMAFSTEPYLIEIGNHVAIANDTLFLTHDGGIWCFRKEIENADVFGKIKIGDNVFIGSNCTVLPNTVVGDNCIVGAGSVLRGKFPENSVIAGNPAKVIYNMNIQKLMYLQSPGTLKTQNLSDFNKQKVIREHFNLK